MTMPAITPLQFVKLIISQGYNINDIDFGKDNEENDCNSEDVIVVEN